MVEPIKTARRVALGFILGLAVLTAIGCGGNDSPSEPTPEARPSAATSSTTAREAIAALRRADLEVGTVSKITPDQLGVAPNVATSALRFLIPSLGGDSGGRAFSFESVKDLRKTKKAYDDLGKESGLLFSWTYANEDALVLVQINGDLPAKKARQYGRVVRRLK